ncbi:MAG: DNA adenine methylase [Candidatus Izemoplasmatales bacterium]|nr:DNA adenine methylase [Candidatus Izemoplasmatales bacterium]
MIIYDCPWLFSNDLVIRAWAFWVVTNQGFSSRIGSWGYDREKRAITIQNKVDQFQELLSERIRFAQIEQNEAHKVIKSRDSIDTFFYVDPPYIDTNQGHYGGYTHEHFRRDLDVLVNIKGKFLLSTYPSDILDEYIKANNWFTKEIDKPLSSSYTGTVKRKRKTEVLTANYPI